MSLALAFSLPVRTKVGTSVPASTVLSAVSTTPESYITSTQLGTTDTAVGICSFWLRGGVGTLTDQANDFNWTMAIRDVASNNGTGTTWTSENVPGLNFGFDNESTTYGTVKLSFCNSSSVGSDQSPSIHGYNATLLSAMGPFNGQWTHHAFAWDLTTQGARKFAYYINGVKQTSASGVDAATGAIIPYIFGNPRGFMFGGNAGNGGTSAFDLAQFVLDNQQSFLDSSSNITIINKLYNNGPVDLGTNASSALGYTPLVYLNGDKTSFLTNKGTSTATFSMATQLAGATPAVTPLLYTADFGPGGPSIGRPYRQWMAGNALSGFTSSTSSAQISNRGFSIKVGDLLISGLLITETSTDVDRQIQTPSGWTAFAGMPKHYLGSGDFPFNWALIWKVATSVDVTSAGQSWGNIGGGSAPTYNWTTNGVAPQYISWTLLNYTQANASAPIQAFAVATQTASTTLTAPSVTPTSSASTLISLFGLYSVPYTQTTTFPTGQFASFKRQNSSSGSGPNYTMSSDEVITGTSATGTRTATASGSAPYLSASIIIGS